MSTKTESISLRAMEPEDIDNIYCWENDPTVWVDSAAHQPFSRHALRQFIEENSSVDIYSCRQLRLMADIEIITNYESEIALPTAKTILSTHYTVGCVDIFDFDPYHRRAGVGIIVDSRHRRQGYGTLMLAELEKFACQHLSLHQLHCTIAADNGASLALFEKVGYKRCGTLSQWVLSNNSWIDAHTYQKLLKY